MVTLHASTGHRTAGKSPIPLITDAQSGRSKDLAARQRHYLITMTFRLLCFISMIFVPGPFRWVLLAAAVFLPYIAVVFANQKDDRSPVIRTVKPGEPSPAPALHAGPIINEHGSPAADQAGRADEETEVDQASNAGDSARTPGRGRPGEEG